MLATRDIFRFLTVHLSIALILTACTSAATPIPTAPLPTQTSMPTEQPTKRPTELPTSTSTPGSSFLKFPSVRCCKGVAVEAGRYEVPGWLGMPLSVEVGEGWKVLNEEAALLLLIGKGLNVQNNPSQMIVFMNASVEGSAQDLISAVQQAPQLTSMAEPVSVTIAGFPGTQLDSTAKPNPEYAGSGAEDIAPGVQFLPVFMKYFTPGFAWTTSSPEARLRTIVLTVNGQTLLLYLEAPQQEFDVFVSEAEPVLQTLELISK